MNKTEGTITENYGDYKVEKTLFTYNENEMQENKINKNNANLILRPKYVSTDVVGLKGLGLNSNDKLIYGFIEFFLEYNELFYCTNEQLSELFEISENTVGNSISRLEGAGLIKTHNKIKAGGGKIRFISLTHKNWVSTKHKICVSETQKLGNIYNKIIDNKSLSLEGACETQTTQSSVGEKDTHTSSSTKEGTPPTPPQLLEAYENEKSLVQMIGNSKAVLERAEYKQSKKSRAYKTVSGFIQQLYGKVDTVRFGELRGDTGTRFEYAVNKTKENEWKDIYRTEKEEREYQFYKKSLYLKKQENE